MRCDMDGNSRMRGGTLEGSSPLGLDQNRLTTRTELIPSIPKELLRM
jgi:hypothetical protein